MFLWTFSWENFDIFDPPYPPVRESKYSKGLIELILGFDKAITWLHSINPKFPQAIPRSLNFQERSLLQFFPISSGPYDVIGTWLTHQSYPIFIFQIPFPIQLNNGHPVRNHTDNLNNRIFISKHQVVKILFSHHTIYRTQPFWTLWCPMDTCIKILNEETYAFECTPFKKWEVTRSSFSFWKCNQSSFLPIQDRSKSRIINETCLHLAVRLSHHKSDFSIALPLNPLNSFFRSVWAFHLFLRLTNESLYSFQDGKSALHLAAASGHTDTVAALTLNGADVTCLDYVSI